MRKRLYVSVRENGDLTGGGPGISSSGPYQYARDKGNLHIVDISLADRRCWKRMKLCFIDAGLAEDVRKRIELLADKRQLKFEDMQKGGRKLRGFEEFAHWMNERTDEERRKRIESGCEAIAEGAGELPSLPPDMHEAIMGNVFGMEDTPPSLDPEDADALDKAFAKFAKMAGKRE